MESVALSDARAGGTGSPVERMSHRAEKEEAKLALDILEASGLSLLEQAVIIGTTVLSVQKWRTGRNPTGRWLLLLLRAAEDIPAACRRAGIDTSAEPPKRTFRWRECRAARLSPDEIAAFTEAGLFPNARLSATLHRFLTDHDLTKGALSRLLGITRGGLDGLLKIGTRHHPSREVVRRTILLLDREKAGLPLNDLPGRMIHASSVLFPPHFFKMKIVAPHEQRNLSGYLMDLASRIGYHWKRLYQYAPPYKDDFKPPLHIVLAFEEAACAGPLTDLRAGFHTQSAYMVSAEAIEIISAGIPDTGEDLLALIDSVLPQRLPLIFCEDARQELALRVLTGEVSPANLPTEARRVVRMFWRTHDLKYRTVSLDATTGSKSNRNLEETIRG